LFSALPAESLLPVASLSWEVSLDADEELFKEGDLGDALYVIVQGTVRIIRSGRVIAKLPAGECVGEMAALDWEPRSATVVADVPTRLIRLDRNDLMDLLRDHPELVRGLAQVLVQRIRNK
jgi:CRP-like cAMP-binding protein